MECYHAALDKVKRTNDSLAEDGGPTAAELEMELEWVFDDAIAEPSIGRSSGWRRLKLESLSGCMTSGTQQSAHPSTTVRLRLPLGELTQLWQQRIEDRVPLQYLLNAAHWRDMVLAVGPGALIPRPETELLVDFIINKCPQQLGVYADLGTGSGALAIGLARAAPPGSRVIAVDRSRVACAWARLNSDRLGVAHIVEVMEGDWYGPLAGLEGQLAGILSNPPYIPPDGLSVLQAEVGRHEPCSALAGGGMWGLDCLVTICSGAARMLRPGGFLMLETNGAEQSEEVVALLQGSFAACPGSSAIRADLRGVRRFVTVQKQG